MGAETASSSSDDSSITSRKKKVKVSEKTKRKYDTVTSLNIASVLRLVLRIENRNVRSCVIDEQNRCGPVIDILFEAGGKSQREQ